MFIHFLVKVVQSLFYLFARILFDNFTQLLFVEGQLIAHLLLTYTLGYTCLNPFKEMLQARKSEQFSCDVHVTKLSLNATDILTHIKFF